MSRGYWYLSKVLSSFHRTLVMISSLLSLYVLSAVSWVVWQLFKRYVVKSPLDQLQGPPSSSFLFGNIPQLLSVDGWEYQDDVLQRYGRAMRITGALGERLLLTYDPKALHHILVKDQYTYEESAGFITRNLVYFGDGLLSTLGDQHKKQRKMMNPVFSINHMRDMIPLFYDVTERLRKVLRKKVQDGPKEIDLLQWMSRTALELIGQSGMGYSFDSLTDDHDYHPYSRSVKRLGSLTSGPIGFFTNQFVFPFASNFGLNKLKRLLVEITPWKRVQDIKTIVDLMHQTAVDIIEAKKKALNSSDPQVVEEEMSKKDIISILIRANAAASESERLTDIEVYGQVTTFVFAGMDTTSSALSRIIHLLASHKDVQDKLRKEIKDAQKDGQLSYDQLVSLPYLDAVCRETLRVYPPVNMAALRTCRKDMILPFSKPIMGVDGKEMSEMMVPKDTNILVSIRGANRNPELWGEDAYEWNPDRWMKQLPEAVGEAHMPGVYSHLMTFLGGGRACIGFKFSQLEMKVVLSVLLSSFRFSLPKEDKVVWKMTGVSGPYVESSEGLRPKLPLIVSPVLDIE